MYIPRKTGEQIEFIGSDYKYLTYEGDKLTKYGTETFVYDNMGNPTTYRNKSATWKGRQLLTFNGNTFTYDGRGRRTGKNSLTFLYDAEGNLVKQSNGLEFYYDFEGIAACKYNGNTYIYITDGLGNVIALIDSNGNEVVQYWYDAWGNHKVVNSSGVEITDQNHIGNLNPFRYRGYYFDRETGLYFLQTRYYDPEIGRFLNRDSVNYADPGTINGLNLYTYCLNNPVEYVDPTGSTALGFLTLLAISSFASWIITNAFGEDIAGGVSSVVNGGTAIYTGSSLLSFGPIGWLAGGTLILIGVGTMLFGANEIALGVTGTNYLQSWTGMSDATYNGLYVGLNIASVIGTIAGGVYMNYANVNIYGNHIKTTKGAKPFQRYSLIDANGLKQYRFFNSRGNAWYDKDFRHAGNFRFPHYHGWDNGTRIGGHWTIMDLINWLF